MGELTISRTARRVIESKGFTVDALLAKHLRDAAAAVGDEPLGAYQTTCTFSSDGGNPRDAPPENVVYFLTPLRGGSLAPDSDTSAYTRLEFIIQTRMLLGDDDDSLAECITRMRGDEPNPWNIASVKAELKEMVGISGDDWR